MTKFESFSPIIRSSGQEAVKAMTHLKNTFMNMSHLRESLGMLREDEFRQLPDSRRLKIQRHFRERINDPHHVTPILTLCGDWLKQAGFECHQHVRIISLQHMIIISPEKLKMDTSAVKLF
jgi:hypothetical protein